MKKFYKVMNTTTGQEIFVKAHSMKDVEMWIIRYLPDWYFGMNIVQVNQDKTIPKCPDFTAVAVREWYVREYHTQDDKEILRQVFEELKTRAIY